MTRLDIDFAPANWRRSLYRVPVWAWVSGAAGLVYGYTGLVPVGLWAVLKWYGSESANFLECACLYGYANLVWIVVALVSWSPISSKSCLSHVPFLCVPISPFVPVLI